MGRIEDRVSHKTGKRLVFLINNFVPPAITIVDLNQCQWQIDAKICPCD